MKKALKFLLVLMVLPATAQQVTTKVTLTSLHQVYEQGYEFKVNENEVHYINRAGLSMVMGKVSKGEEKPSKPVKVSGFKYKDIKIKLRNAVELNHKIYAICEANDKKSDKNYVLAYECDFKNMTLVDNPKLLAEYEDMKKIDVTFTFEKCNETDFFMKKHTSGRDGLISMDYSLIDTDMNIKWTRKLQNPEFSGGDFTIESSYLKDENNMVLIGVHYPDGRRKNKKSGAANYKYHVLYYYDGLQYMKDFEVSLDNNFITDMEVGINAKGMIVCAGFYSKTDKFALTGSFFLTINKETKKAENVKYKEFDNDFALSLMKKRQKRKAKRKSDSGDDVEAPQFDLRSLVFKQDGRTVLMAEDYYVVQHCTRDSKGNVNCYYTYHYDDLIAIQFDEQGNIDWNIKIEKKLMYYYPTTNSFALVERDNKLHLIYNENLRNFKVMAEDDEDDNQSEKAASRKNSAPVLVTIDDRGKYEKEVLMMPEGKKSVSITADDFKELSDNVYIFKMVDNTGKNMYYKLSFKK